MAGGTQLNNPWPFGAVAPVWHPWIRVNWIIATVRATRWDAGAWPAAKVALLDAIAERKRLARSVWWN